MASLGDHMKNACHHSKDYVCQTSEYFQIWKAVQVRLLGMDAVESEGASQDPSAKPCSTQTLPSSHKYLCSVSSKRKVRPRTVIGPVSPSPCGCGFLADRGSCPPQAFSYPAPL